MRPKLQQLTGNAHVKHKYAADSERGAPKMDKTAAGSGGVYDTPNAAYDSTVIGFATQPL